jgi:hypothetical protein
MNFDIKQKQSWKYRKATADMLWLTRSQRRLNHLTNGVNPDIDHSAFTLIGCIMLAAIIFIGGVIVKYFLGGHI